MAKKAKAQTTLKAADNVDDITLKQEREAEQRYRLKAFSDFLGGCAIPEGADMPVAARRKRTTFDDNLRVKNTYGGRDMAGSSSEPSLD